MVAAIVTLGMLRGPRAWASDDRPEGRRFLRGPWTRPRLLDLARDAGIAVAPYLAVVALAWVSIAGGVGFGDATWPFVAGAVTIVVGRTPTLFAIATASAIVLFTIVLAIPVETRVRTFYGVTEIRARGDVAYAEYHGTTLHGVQYRDGRSSVPTTYYVAAGPIGDVFTDVRARVGPATIGIVGLGTGTLAAYSVPGDELTYFEIDPAVVDLATSGGWFTYLADAPVEPRVVVGDARLSLQGEPQRTYDLLVFDAFSSDAIPAHLLTREAMAMFAQKLQARRAHGLPSVESLLRPPAGRDRDRERGRTGCRGPELPAGAGPHRGDRGRGLRMGRGGLIRGDRPVPAVGLDAPTTGRRPDGRLLGCHAHAALSGGATRTPGAAWCDRAPR